MDVALLVNYIESIDNRSNIMRNNKKLRLPAGVDIQWTSINEMLCMRHLPEKEEKILAMTEEKVEAAYQIAKNKSYKK